MNCSTAQGTEIRFLSSGIRILPNKVEYKSDNTNYDYARVDITRQAGDHIKKNAKNPEPVEIHTGDRKLADVFYNGESLTLDHNSAQLELLDGRKVLEMGVIDKKFHSVTLGDVFKFFKKEVEEANIGNVIRKVELTGDVDRSRETESFVEDAKYIVGSDADDNSGVSLGVAKFNAWISRSMNGLGPLKKKEEGGFDFNQASLAQVLQLIEEEFSLNSYITEDRVLKVGHPEVDSEMYWAGFGSNMFTVSEYNLTYNPSSVKMVTVKGGYHDVRNFKNWEYPAGTNPKQSDKMQWWAFASTEWPIRSETEMLNDMKPYTPDPERVEGEVISLTHKSSSDQMTLKKLAVRKLMQELKNKSSGNIEVNPLKSSINLGYPHDVNVGDTIGIFPGERQSTCLDKLESDIFTVSGVSHTIDGQNGWSMTIDVSRIPLQDIYTAAMPWPKIPETGSDYENYKDFYRKALKYDQGSGFIDNDRDGTAG